MTEAIDAVTLIVLLNAAEAPSSVGAARLWEIEDDIVRKGGRDAHVALGRPIDVPANGRSRAAIRAAIAHCVERGWCEVVASEFVDDEKSREMVSQDRVLDPGKAFELLESDALWAYPSQEIQVRLTAEGQSLWETGEFARRFRTR